jgi:transcriptional regulator with XRE-family HTH domain
VPAPTGTITLKLNVAAFDRKVEEAGWKGYAQIANQLGLDPSTVSRVHRGEQRPGIPFVDACVRAFGATSYTELFARELQ